MKLTNEEAIKALQSIRNCLDPRFSMWPSEERKDEALRMAIEKLKECEDSGNTIICK